MIVQTLAKVQEHKLSFIKVGQLTMAHMFQDQLINQVHKVSTMQHAFMTMDYGDESDHDLISTEILEDIHDRSQNHPDINRKEAWHTIRDPINKRQ